MNFKTYMLRFHVLLCILTFGAFAGRLQGQIKSPFMLRYQTSIKGNMTLIANNVLSTTATGNYNGTLGNHNVVTVFVDVDQDTSTFNSSNATLTLPPGLVCPVMKKVFLYWSAADFEDPGVEPNWSFNYVKLKVPGDSVYTTVEADDVIYQGRLEHFYNDPYTCVKDITSLVSEDPTGTYWVANVKAKKGSLISHGGGNTGTSGGWIIVVVYESTSLPQKNIAIFDGYVHVATEMVPNPLPFTFSGFQTVPTGNVNVEFMMGSLEGDWDLTGDYCEIQKVDGSWLTMSSALRQTNNFFHSIIGLDGAQFLNRVPASQNTLGFDADKFPIPNTGNGVIGNSQTSATIRVGTDQEIYGMFLIGFVVDVWYPDILTLFTVPAMPGGTGGSVNAGDTLTFSIVSGNNGNDAAQDLILSTTIPPGLDFLQVLPPVPIGVSTSYNITTKALNFNIPDDLVEVGDPPFNLQYKTKVITDCILLKDTAITHASCQVTASYHGAVNPAQQSNLSSTGLTSCGIGNLSPATFTIIPPPVNPVAINDSVTATEDTPVTIPVLANDTDCDHNINRRSLSIISGPRHGSAIVSNNSGYLVYSPASNYNGYDTLSYRICDFDNLCDTALVFITVIPVNDPPVVQNEVVSLCENTSVSGNVLANDSDPVENTAMTAIVPPIREPANGSVVLATDGSFTYTPVNGYSGMDTIIISVCDSGYPMPPQCKNDTISITVINIIQALAGADQHLCDDTTVNLYGNMPLPGTGRWIQVSGPDSTTITPTGLSNATVTRLIAGQYEFSYTITNGDCISADTLTITNDPPLAPAFAGADQELCLNGPDTTSTHLASNVPPIGSGMWSQTLGPTIAGILNPANPNTLVSNLTTGTYQFAWTVNSSICPSVSDSVIITIHQISTANAGADNLICAAEPFLITGSTALNYLHLYWQSSGTGTFDDATVLHPVYTPGVSDITAGKVDLILNTTSFSGCPSNADSMLLVISRLPVAVAGPDSSTCTTIPFSFSGAEVFNSDSVLWTHNGQGELTDYSTLTPTYTPAPAEEGTVTLIIKAFGNKGCDKYFSSDERLLRIYQPVAADAGPDQSITAGTSVSLNANPSQGSENFMFTWEPSGLFVDNSLEKVQTVPLDTSTTFFISVKDLSTGCDAHDSIRINIQSTPDSTEESCIIFHNVITPNGDGANDTWIIDCIENFPLNMVSIFDRWGDKIIAIENYNNTSHVWKGTNDQGKNIPDGTYYYIVSITKGGTYSGWVFVRGGNQ